MASHRVTPARRSVLVVPALGTLLLTSACGGGDADASGGESTSFSFTFATSNNMESPYESLAKAYMEENPEITIDLEPQPNDRYGETLRTQLQAGNAPDVVQTVPGAGQDRSVLPLAEAGFLEPLGDAAASLVPAGEEALYTHEDELYAQPVDFTVTGFVYNSTAAEAAGVDEFPDAYPELEELCGRLAGEGRSVVAMAGSAPPNAGLTAMAVSATRVYADDPDWNEKRANGEVSFADSEGWRETLETVIALQDAECLQPGAVGAGFDAITNGLAQGTSLGAFIPGGAATEIQRTAPDSEFVIEAFPPAPGGDARILAGPNYSLSVNAASAQKEAAQDFLDWVAEPEQAQLFAELSGVLPVTGLEDVDLSTTEYAPVADLLQSESYSALPNSAWPNQSVYEALSTGVQGLLTDQRSVEDVLTAMDDAWEG